MQYSSLCRSEKRCKARASCCEEHTLEEHGDHFCLGGLFDIIMVSKLQGIRDGIRH